MVYVVILYNYIYIVPVFLLKLQMTHAVHKHTHFDIKLVYKPFPLGIQQVIPACMCR